MKSRRISIFTVGILMGLSAVGAGSIPSASAQTLALAMSTSSEVAGAEEIFGDIQARISNSINGISATFGDQSFDFWQTGEFESTRMHVRTLNPQVVSDFQSVSRSLNIPLDVEHAAPLTYEATNVIESGQIEDTYGDSAIVGMSFDVADGVIVVDFGEDAADSASQAVAHSETEVSFSAEDGEQLGDVNGFPVVANVVGETGDSANVRGGSALSGCTVGFTASYRTRNGFITADHCGASMTYWNTAVASGSPLSTGKRVVSSNRNVSDIAFWSVAAKDTPVPYFWGTSTTTLLRADTVITPYVGQRLCHRGSTSGMKCGNVSSVTYRPTWSNACGTGRSCSSTFVSVPAKQAGGDSGGPWFSGRHPVGIHKGGSANLSVFSKLTYSPARVMIEP